MIRLNIISRVFALFFCIALLSCGMFESQEEGIVGKWKANLNATVQERKLTDDKSIEMLNEKLANTTIEFKEDSTYTYTFKMKGKDTTQTGRYGFDNGQLYHQVEVEGQLLSLQGDIILKSDKLYMTPFMGVIVFDKIDKD